MPSAPRPFVLQPNAPNLLGGCLKGDRGEEDTSISVNRIVVGAADGPPGTPLTGGSLAHISVEMSCGGYQVSLYVYIGASPVTSAYPPPQWDLVPGGFQPCYYGGDVTFEFEARLPHVPQHGGGALLAVRAFEVPFFTGPLWPLAPCPAYAGSDADDLLFYALPGGEGWRGGGRGPHRKG